MKREEETIAGERSALDLGPLRPRSSSTLVADSLRRLIALGALSPGERLPSERELAGLCASVAIRSVRRYGP